MIMKKIMLLCIISSLVAACGVETKKRKTAPYSISGITNIIHNGKIVELISSNDGMDYIEDIDTITNNSFVLTAKLKENKFVKIKIKGKKEALPFYLRNEITKITWDSSALKTAQFIDNPDQERLSALQVALANNPKDKSTILQSFIQTDPKDTLATFILSSYQSDSLLAFKNFKKLHALLEDSPKKESMQQYILEKENEIAAKKTVDSLAFIARKEAERKKRIASRSKATLFGGEGINGTTLNLSSYVSKNKVIILDFWASWCQPCRGANPSLVRLYKKYHKQGLEIIGISGDKPSQKHAWKAAVSADRLTWPQIIDDNNRIAFMYSVSKIPHTFVIDKNGRIAGYKISAGSAKMEQLVKQLLNE